MSDVNAKPATDAPKLPAPPRVSSSLASGGRIAAIVPQDFESAWRMAQVVVAAGMAPKSVNTIEKACVAIMHGMEVGLTPMAALQSIAVVNGSPTIWGDGMLGLVRSSGLLESIEEEQETDKDGPTVAWCNVKRKGEAGMVTGCFTRAEAMKARLWTKEGPWTQYPRRMMQMRARAFALRDAFADVLRGLHSREEAEDIPASDVTGRGSVSFAEPRRSDFRAPATEQPADDGAQDEPSSPGTAHGHDEGDGQAGAHAPAAGGDSKSEAAGQPASEEQTGKRSWKLAEGIVGQEPRLKAILELLDLAETPADVDAIEAEHAEFLGKLGRNKSDVMRTFRDRKTTLTTGEVK